jgi:hypothetical protein
MRLAAQAQGQSASACNRLVRFTSPCPSSQAGSCRPTPCPQGSQMIDKRRRSTRSDRTSEPARGRQIVRGILVHGRSVRRLSPHYCGSAAQQYCRERLILGRKWASHALQTRGKPESSRPARRGGPFSCERLRRYLPRSAECNSFVGWPRK